ncbi:App1 family protein [Aureimonas jatrophae]|uniref:Phosphatidate phosphatase APP1 n=1 Tax=Aureimonas jatrophae TaxID=1166073 RepID=A0A1H0HCD6_9HYPH|nr:phosphatase domain-containing protein [Aureimonas jatrophae]MBB3950520.1 phosphatidate phosphatase APP1 [Aureimonas jatrophae]SDO16802.1 Phosphatidate phosphatase APP1 [Aureimonas jatrophae]
MTGTKAVLRVAAALARRWDDGRYGLKLRLGMTSDPILLPYRGYASGGRMRLGGRVVEDEGVVGAEPSRSRWTQLKRTFRRYETDEIRNAVVDWTAGGASGQAISDAQGFFGIDAPLVSGENPGSPWLPVALALRSAPGYAFRPLVAEGLVRVVSPEATFGVVSDIDDTVIETGAQNLFRHWRTVALNSAEGRVAFPGVAFLFRALAAGRGSPETNPIFYVSSSPWNLYDLFEDVLRLRRIPPGPMFLKDFGLNKTQWLTGSHRRHKLTAIDRLLSAYPQLRFVLVGDTGQSDAPIYADVVRRHPGRILAVYMRDVTPRGFRPRVRRAMRRIEAAGVPLVSGATLDGAARHAEEAGLVEPGTAERMRDEIRADAEALRGGT